MEELKHVDESAIRQIAASVLLQTMADWVMLLYKEKRSGKPHNEEPPPAPVHHTKTGRTYKKRKKTEIDPSYDEIRSFLKGPDGIWICEIVDMDPQVILAKLEGWLRTYRKCGVLPNRKYTKPHMLGVSK